MRQHPQLSRYGLVEIDRLPEAVSHIIAQHHECQDGRVSEDGKAGGPRRWRSGMALADT